MKKLEELTIEELAEAVTLKVELLVDEDEENMEVENFEDACGFIRTMGDFPEGFVCTVFRRGIDRVFDYYVGDNGIDPAEMAELIGIDKKSLYELVSTPIIDVEEEDEMGEV